jgi:pimeloyl-ACP methyl ester carboxylesterase
VHVLGNSTGASVALILAKRRPDLVGTLLLEEPPAISIFLPSTPPTLWEVFNFLISQPWSFLPVIMFAATVISPTMTAFQKGDDEKGLQTFARGILGNEFYAKVSTNRLEQMQVNIKPHAALFLGVGLPQFLENDARNISTPTLMITGEKTVSAHQHLNRRLAALIPGAAESVIPHASHLSYEDNPSAVFEAIWAFLERTAQT